MLAISTTRAARSEAEPRRDIARRSACACSQPAVGVGREVGVVGEDLLRRHVLLELHQEAALADAGVQRVEALACWLSCVRREVRVRRAATCRGRRRCAERRAAEAALRERRSGDAGSRQRLCCPLELLGHEPARARSRARAGASACDVRKSGSSKPIRSSPSERSSTASAGRPAAGARARAARKSAKSTRYERESGAASWRDDTSTPGIDLGHGLGEIPDLVVPIVRARVHARKAPPSPPSARAPSRSRAPCRGRGSAAATACRR